MTDESQFNLAFAFDLPPKELVAYLRAQGLEITWNWEDSLEAIKRQAFTISRVEKLEVLQTVRDQLALALENGTTSREFVKTLKPRLAKLGWWGERQTKDSLGNIVSEQLLTPHRLNLIYRNTTQNAYNAGRWKAQFDNRDNKPYWIYVAIRDSVTRPSHLKMHGRVYRADDPIWEYIYPPNGHHCRCRVRSLSQREVDRKNLKVFSSLGNITAEQKLVSVATGELKTVVGIKTGQDQTFFPDIGWDHNPGIRAFNPSIDEYDDDLKLKFFGGG